MITTLVGPDAYAKQLRINQILSDTAKIRLDASEGLTPILEQIGQSDLFGQQSAVIIDNVSKLTSDELKLFSRHLSGNLDTNQQIIITVDEKLPAKSSLLGSLQQHPIEYFPAPTMGNLINWVQREADRLHIKVDKSIISQFIVRFGSNKFALATELQTISWLEQPSMTSDQLNNSIGVGTEIEVFGLTDAWAAQNSQQALKQLQQLWRQQTYPTIIIGMLERQVRLLYLASLSDNKNLSAANLAKLLSLAPFVASKYAQWLKRWQPDRLKQSLIQLYQLDKGIKTGNVPAELGLEKWIIQTLKS